MKTKLTSIFSFLLLTIIMGFTTPAFSIVSTMEVIKRLIILVDKLESDNQQILFVQIDNISKRQKSTQTYELSKGSDYKIIVVGDNDRVQDIDLIVLDENDNKVGEDSDSSNVAVVNISPKWTGKFKITTWAASMQANDAFYAIIIARSN